MWNHFDSGSCPGQAIGVRTRLDNAVTGFIPTKFLSDKVVKHPEERVKVSKSHISFLYSIWRSFINNIHPKYVALQKMQKFENVLWTLTFVCFSAVRLAWLCTAASWRLTSRSSTWISLVEHLTWVTRTMNGSFPKIPTMILMQRQRMWNRKRNKRRNSLGPVSIDQVFFWEHSFYHLFKWLDFFYFLSLAYIKRVIAHPSFHNINFKQAEKMMESMDQGDVVIRPSSKGENHLTVTWKVADGIYQHVDIREEGKENAFSLGHTLWINNEVSCVMSHTGLWRSP